jgi:hypothetical protein
MLNSEQITEGVGSTAYIFYAGVVLLIGQSVPLVTAKGHR